VSTTPFALVKNTHTGEQTTLKIKRMCAEHVYFIIDMEAA